MLDRGIGRKREGESEGESDREGEVGCVLIGWVSE
jgi:hypothetical protein